MLSPVIAVAVTPTCTASRGCAQTTGASEIEANGAWQPPQLIAYMDGPGALATGHEGSNQLDLFWFDYSGTLNEMWTTGYNTVGQNTNWNFQFVTGSNVAAPGATLATGIQGGNQLDVFWFDGSGMAQVAWKGLWSGATWGGPAAIGTGNGAPGGNLVTAIQGSNQIDFFYVDKNGAMNVQWPDPGPPYAWNNWQMSPTGIAPAGSPVAAAIQNSIPQLDVFTTGNWGEAVFWVPGLGNWAGPMTFWPPGQ